MNEYRIITSHPQFEINPYAEPQFYIRTVKSHIYLNVWITKTGYYECILARTYGGDGKKHRIHRLVAETFLGDIPKGYVIDHISTQKLDNRPENIRITTQKGNMNNSITLNNISNSQKKRFENIEERKHHSASQKKRFENIEEHEKISESVKQYYREHPEKAKEHSEFLKQYYREHPEIIKERSEKIKEYCSNPENIKKMSEITTKYYKEHPESKKQISNTLKKYYSNEENRKKRAIPVLQIDKNGNIINEFFGIAEAGRKTGIPATNISKCIRGIRRVAGGFIWKYK